MHDSDCIHMLALETIYVMICMKSIQIHEILMIEVLAAC